MIKFNPDNFSASVESRSLKEFLKIAKNFSGDTGFVPCWGSPEGKKVPCRGTEKWQNGSITRHDLSDYPNLEMLSLVLGKRFIAIDCDGITALEKLSEIIEKLGELPQTLQVSSELNVRHCFIFAIPEDTELAYFQIKTGEKEQLEFRTGEQYQVIAGIHPLTKSAYLSNQNFEIAELASPWLEYIQNEGDFSKLSLQKSKTNSTKIKKDVEIEILPASLYSFVSKETKAFLRYGVCEGSRNVSSFNAACDLLGTASKLEELGINFDGNPEKMFFECYSKIPQGSDPFSIEEFQTIWNSASSQERDCVKDDDILLSIAGMWNEEYQPGVSYELIEDRVSKKLGENPQKIKKEALINQFKLNYPSPTSTEVQIEAQLIYRELGFKGFGSLDDDLIFQSLVRELTAEEVSEEDKNEIKQYVQSIQAKRQHRIDFEPVRKKYENIKDKPNIIGFALNHASKSEVPNEHAIISVLTVLSSLLPKQFRYCWNDDGVIRPNIFSVLVAPAAYGKDKIFGIYTKPLQDLANKALNEYLDIKKHSKEITSEWNSLGKKDRDEAISQYCNSKGLFLDELSVSEKKAVFFELNNAIVDPKKSHPYLINTASMQSINQQSGDFTDYGILINPSELKGFIDNTNSVNKNKAGLDVLLPVWNGDPTLSTTKTEELTTRADYYQCSLLSGIQNKRFEQLFDVDDASGIGSRFVYITIDTPIITPIRARSAALREKGNFDLLNFYLDFQKKVTTLLPEIEEIQRDGRTVTKKGTFEIEYEEKSPTEELIKVYHERWQGKAAQIQPTNEGIAAWYRRLLEQSAKFALVIHMLRWYYGLESNPNVISFDAWQEAAQIGLFLESQYEMLLDNLGQKNASKLDDESLFMYERMLSACIKHADKKNKASIIAQDLAGDSLTRRKDFMSKYCPKKAKQMNKPEIHQCWQEMNELGLGVFNKTEGTFTPNRELAK